MRRRKFRSSRRGAGRKTGGRYAYGVRIRRGHKRIRRYGVSRGGIRL